MATYAVGDIQGCYREFTSVLASFDFDPARDRLWLTGDLVNRGPDSLTVLREVRALGERAVTVLGNHDLHLLACAHVAGMRPRPRDTLDPVLAAPDRDELLDWLRHRPLVHHDPALGFTLVHAGLPPPWTIEDARACADEVSGALRGEAFECLLAGMYGDEPDLWDPRLRGLDRLRFILNCLTRMRYCDAEGRLNLSEKGAPGEAARTLVPWFEAAGRRSVSQKIIFGHWSTLRLGAAARRRFKVYPLDTGAVWGGGLTAMRLEDGRLFRVRSSAAVPIG